MTDHRGEWFAALQRLLPHHALSRLTAKLAESESVDLKNRLIRQFIQRFDIDLSELDEANPESYPTFNSFFTRPLKQGARPIAADPDLIVSPVDGTISQIGAIHRGQLLQAKGRQYTAAELIGKAIGEEVSFDQGLFTTIYLSPKDYHRVHMPVSGKLIKSHYIPGQLFSVNDVTTHHIRNLFARNERLVCLFDTAFGRVAIVLVGALLVAGIETVWHHNYAPNRPLVDDTKIDLAKGDELGRFKYGSTVIILMEKNEAAWGASLSAGDQVRMGAVIGRRV
ncbi:MAG: archaetidylserine decarboxylase [bacterium]